MMVSAQQQFVSGFGCCEVARCGATSPARVLAHAVVAKIGRKWILSLKHKFKVAVLASRQKTGKLINDYNKSAYDEALLRDQDRKVAFDVSFGVSLTEGVLPITPHASHADVPLEGVLPITPHASHADVPLGENDRLVGSISPTKAVIRAAACRVERVDNGYHLFDMVGGTLQVLDYSDRDHPSREVIGAGEDYLCAFFTLILCSDKWVVEICARATMSIWLVSEGVIQPRVTFKVPFVFDDYVSDFDFMVTDTNQCIAKGYELSIVSLDSDNERWMNAKRDAEGYKKLQWKFRQVDIYKSRLVILSNGVKLKHHIFSSPKAGPIISDRYVGVAGTHYKDRQACSVYDVAGADVTSPTPLYELNGIIESGKSLIELVQCDTATKLMQIELNSNIELKLHRFGLPATIWDP
ncbi:hypothetical protein Pelo_7940 [Pelomyxa schiedti]|nr:hypothetical protein Pelo_7940 [Pelomyxa schiedti]